MISLCDLIISIHDSRAGFGTTAGFSDTAIHQHTVTSLPASIRVSRAGFRITAGFPDTAIQHVHTCDLITSIHVSQAAVEQRLC